METPYLGVHQTGSRPSFTYDANGNLTSDGSTTYVFDIENRLVTASGAKNATLRYDPLGRIYETVGGGAMTRFLQDGDELVVEYDASGTMLRRYAHGKNVDDPVVWYEGGGLVAARWLRTDHQGSVIVVADTSGAALAINSYDEYGIPKASNLGRFQYTGQAWIPELGMYYYKARIYSPTLGRFMQTDPVGYQDDLNLYAYVGNDPLGFKDPTGLGKICNTDVDGKETTCTEIEDDDISVTGEKQCTGLCAFGDGLGSAIVPGYDLGKCTFVSECSGADWAFAVVDLAPGLGKAVSKGRKGWNAWRAAKSVCGCVVAGTLVSTPEGLSAIETLKVGDLVDAYDVSTGKISPQRVLAVIETEPKPTYNVKLRAASGETAQFEATNDHPWLNVAKEWRNTEDLVVGDRLIAADGERFEVTEIVLTGQVNIAYTLTVDELHTYIMGGAGLIVHNACRKWKDPKKASGKGRRQMEQRGWTDDQIEEAVSSGKSFPARNNYSPSNGATRYVHPENGRSVVIDNATGEIIQVGGDGFVW